MPDDPSPAPRRADPPRGAPSAGSRSAAWLAAAVLAFGLALTAIGSAVLARQLDAEAAARFERQADRVLDEVRRRLAAPAHALGGIVGVFAASASVDRAEFRAFVDTLRLDAEQPGVTGIGVVSAVPRDRADEFAERALGDLMPGFRIRNPGPGLDLLVVWFVEPLGANSDDIGRDFGADPVRRAAIERAVAGGEVALSAALPDAAGQHLLALPIYRRGTDPATPWQRRAALQAVAFARIDLARLLAGAEGAVDAQLTMHLDPATGRDGAAPARFTTRRALDIAGLALGAEFRSTPQFDATATDAALHWAAAAGVACSVLLAFVVWLLGSRRERAERMAREMTSSLERLAMVAERTSDAVVITDAQRRIVWVNDGFVRMTGWSADEAAGRRPGALLQCERSNPDVIARMRAAFERGEAFAGEIVNRARDGRVYWVELEIQPLRGDDGTLDGWMAVETDITERRRAAAELESARREVERLARVAERTSNAVIITDRDTRITWVNEGFERIYGWRATEVLGRMPYEVLGHPQTEPATLAVLARAAAEGSGCRVEILNRRRDGSEVWIDTEVQPTFDASGEVNGFVEIASDITTQKQARMQLAAALRENEALLATIREHAIVSVADPEGTIIDVNDAFCEISGYARDELVGHTHRVVNSGVQPAMFWAAMWRRISAGQPWRGQVCNRRRDGSLYWVDSIIAPFIGADGSIEKYVSIGTDITASKAAAAELAMQRQRLADIVDATGAGTWEKDLVTGDGVLNEQWAGMLGWSLGEYRAAGIYYLDLLHPDDRGVHDAAHAALVAGDTSALACEFRMRHRDGHWVWVQSRGKIVARDDEGRPRRLAGIHLDVTAQKDQERQLARQRQRLDNIIEGTHVGTWEWNVETGETFFNERWAAIVGCTLEGLAPTSILTWTERCHPEDVSRSAVALERHFNGETPHYECEARMRHADGRWVWVLDRGKLFSRSDDGRPRWMAGTRMDITERKRAEAEARAAAELLRGAIDTVNEAFVLYGPDDRLVLCNEKYRNLYALSADLIVPGARFEDIVRGGALRGQYPEAEGRVDEWVAERIALHLAGDVDLVQRIDGGRWLRIVERRMPDGHIVGFRIDVTEIMRAKQEAEDASRAKSQFLANMSHEIRTPMNAILGMLALLQKTDLDARQRDYAGKTEGAARSLLGLLNDILDFSKVEAGKMTLDPQPFRLDRLLGDLAVILAASVGAKPLEVLFDIDPAVPHALVGDAMRLQQVLINLAGNAIKFTPSGEVVVGVRQLASAPGRARLAFWVRDTGIGIAPEHQQRIFSGFTQAEASTTRRFGGTGLGLAICQRLVGMMGGALALDSAPGQGSRFHFEIELPVDDAAAPVVPGSALRVLVVDDNPTARDVLATMCAALGWQADTATGGEDALSRLESVAAGGRRYDAVFVDWQMPGLDGWQTSERIRALAGGDLPLIVMVTAHGREMLSRRDPAQQMLLNGFLVKPVTASMLQAAVEAARPGTAGGTPTGGATVSASRRLQGMRLLVVEDNPNNQQVARELLEDEGAVVRLAGDGREGVQAIAASPDGFDAVLMDLQMPVMDGLAATACIRGELGLAALPIIAMTANAMASDREACLAAGMNDHVGKPFDLDHLVAVLRRHAGRGPSGDAPARAPAALDADCVAAARDAGIDLAAAVARLGGNVAAYARMARSFARDASALAAEIEAGRRAGDREQVARAAHTLKGLAGTLGAGALSADAARHERALKAADGPWPEGREVLAELERVAAALDALAARLQPAAADTPPGIDRAQLAALLDELGALLRDSDMRALDVHAALVERFGAALGERLQPLDASIGMLDFAAALPHVDALQAALAGEGA